MLTAQENVIQKEQNNHLISVDQQACFESESQRMQQHGSEEGVIIMLTHHEPN